MLERELRDMAFVPRWGIIRRLKDQSVAEHSFFVALYAWQICHALGLEDHIDACLRHALVHDFDETLTGDIPGPVKRMMRVEKHDVTSEAYARIPAAFKSSMATEDQLLVVQAVVKIANRLDELVYINTERQMGNQSIPPAVFDNCMIGFNQAVKELEGSGARIKGLDLMLESIGKGIGSSACWFSRVVGG